MKKIKFRGISVNSNEFIYGLVLEKDGEYYINGEKIYKETLSQFIGCYDKDHKEIYEGDIIADNGKYPKIIQYKEEKASFCAANISDLKDEDLFDIWQVPIDSWWERCKTKLSIIGNAYKNKELIDTLGEKETDKEVAEEDYFFTGRI